MSKDFAPLAIVIGTAIVIAGIATAFLMSHPAAAAMASQMPPM